MKTYPNTAAGMKAAQRTFDAQEDPDYYPPKRGFARYRTLHNGEEVSEADVVA